MFAELVRSINTPAAIVLALPAFLTALWIFQIFYFGVKIGRSNGVRAPVVIKTPFGGKLHYP